MRIQLQGLEPVYEQAIVHILELFFEDVEIVTEAEELVITFHITAAEAVVSLDTYVFRRRIEAEQPAELQKKTRYAIVFATLHVLEQYTGISQSWGMLTGVRPTKLLHSRVKQGISKQKAHEELVKQYAIKPKKIELMQHIVERQLAVVPDLYELNNELSIYIGIPYCPTKCAYCTFPAYAINGRQGSVTSFLGGLHYEMERVGQWLSENNIKITTIYFGGGTPTSITADEMDALYETMYSSFPNMEHVREITVEAGRPDTITKEKLEVLKKWNIDRISINPQSYIQETLKAIGRHHTVNETIEKFQLARSMGMNNINMDLIIGLPGEGLSEFQYTLEQTAKLMPESLTVHTLSFKRASEMTKHKNKYKVASRQEVQEMMELAEQWTKANGYNPYYLYRQKNILGNLENVGYSLPKRESIYNIMIMEEQQTILGLGCGASSKFIHPETKKITRFANPKEPKVYNENYEYYTHEKLQLLTSTFGKNE